MGKLGHFNEFICNKAKNDDKESSLYQLNAQCEGDTNMRCCRARFVVASLLTVSITDCVDTRQTDWLVVGRTRLGRCTVIAQRTIIGLLYRMIQNSGRCDGKSRQGHCTLVRNIAKIVDRFFQNPVRPSSEFVIKISLKICTTQTATVLILSASS